METPAAVHRYRNSFSIENILSKPRPLSGEVIQKNNYDLNISVQDHCIGNIKSDHDNLNSVVGGGELRASSPESSFNEDTLDDAKSDITSEDDHGKIKQKFFNYLKI